MRSGGPAAYRTDLAHRTSERRARRRRPAATRGTQTPVLTRGRDPEAVREYEERFATAMMASGLPKMMSRVLVCLYATDTGSLTASELVQRLQVSPASISKAITFLESQDLVRRERGERRRERYVVDDDVWYQAMMASARSAAQLVDTAREGVGVLGPDTAAATRLRASPASSTSSARAPLAPPSRLARFSPRKPDRQPPATHRHWARSAKLARARPTTFINDISGPRFSTFSGLP
jgi:MarR family